MRRTDFRNHWNMSRRAEITALLALTVLTVAPPAFAYLDPSTGSMIISAIVGLFASAGLAIKTYWYKFRNLFRRREPAEQGDRKEPGNPPETEPGQ
jgi:O-antigen/teichoic acid export membrane protein